MGVAWERQSCDTTLRCLRMRKHFNPLYFVMNIEETLHQFVTEWKQELLTSDSDHEEEGRILGKRTVNSQDEGNENTDERTTEMPSRKRLIHREPSPLLVLPACLGEKVVSVPSVNRKDEHSGQLPSLLDTLLADLVKYMMHTQNIMHTQIYL